METVEKLGKYEIKGTLGRGAMGTVYDGWDPIIARRVAIKTVHLPDTADTETEEEIARFRREAQAAGRLIHPNIVGVFDYGETTDVAYIVMEFVDGPPLKSLLDKQERFTLTDTIRIMQDVLTGLQFSHERGVVHRDIKPANVMLTSNGQAKIADFGIARIESSSMTQAGTVLGTPAYMSPEQFMGQVVDARTDIYSSGVLLYQLLTGERPFEGGMSAIMHKALNTEPPAPSQLSVTAPPSFDAVVRRAMAKRPEDRYPSATAFAEAIRSAAAKPAETSSADEATVVAAPKSSPTPVTPARSANTPAPAVASTPAAKRSSMPVIAAAAAVVLLAAGGGGAWWFLLRSSPEPVGQSTNPTPPAVIGNTAPQPPVQTTSNTSSPNTNVTTPPPIQPPPSPPVPTPSNQPSSTQATSEPINQPAAPPPVATPAPPITPSPPSVVTPSNPQPVAAPPPVEPPSANNQQVASVGVGPLRRQLAEWVNTQHCALVGGDVSDVGAVTLSGYAGNSVVDSMRQSVVGFAPPNQIDWRVNGIDTVFCPALDLLHPTTPAFGASGPRLSLAMADGKTRLRDGELVRVRLTMPDFTSRLRVDYLGHDGSVQHLYPQLADPKDKIAADPPRTYAPYEVVNLRHPAWTIGEPYGTDMIMAVASAEPLFDKPRPGNSELADVYLRDLQAAVDAARKRGVRIAGAAATLEALPK